MLTITHGEFWPSNNILVRDQVRLKGNTLIIAQNIQVSDGISKHGVIVHLRLPEKGQIVSDAGKLMDIAPGDYICEWFPGGNDIVLDLEKKPQSSSLKLEKSNTGDSTQLTNNSFQIGDQVELIDKTFRAARIANDFPIIGKVVGFENHDCNLCDYGGLQLVVDFPSYQKRALPLRCWRKLIANNPKESSISSHSPKFNNLDFVGDTDS